MWHIGNNHEGYHEAWGYAESREKSGDVCEEEQIPEKTQPQKKPEPSAPIPNNLKTQPSVPSKP